MPAHVWQVDQVHLLETTVHALMDESFHVIVVLQGDSEMRAYAKTRLGRNTVRLLELSTAVGKWPAVTAGLRLRHDDDQWIAVVDSDGAYSGLEVRDLVEPILKNRADHVIGQRDTVALNAPDDLTGVSRLHVEAFFNTVAQLLVSDSAHPLQYELDIQCGLHAFSNVGLDQWWPRMPYYGGELLLYLNTVTAGWRLGVARVITHTDSASSYSIRDIVANSMAIDRISSAPRSLFEKALHLAPLMYRRWIDDADLFAADIAALMTERWPPE